MAQPSEQDHGERPEVDIRPIRRARARDEVVDQLRALMERGVLRPGDRLPSERDLATRFEVSRATVSQALSVLQATGLVESRTGEGTFARAERGDMNVTDLASALRMARGTLIEQLELRRLIEPQVAFLAAERADAADVDNLQRYLSAQETLLAQGRPFIDEDDAFHLTIARATKNTLLIKMVEGIHKLLRESREHSLLAPGGAELALKGHKRVYEAINRSRAQEAHDAMTAHILDVERLVLQLLVQKEEPSGHEQEPTGP